MKLLTVCFRWNPFPHNRGGRPFCYEWENQFSFHNWQSFSLRIMATLGNKRKLAAVLRETPEKTRSSQSQNTLDTGMPQEYNSQVSKENEGRVTRKLSKEFSRTESRILGALSKLDEFLQNPQVRTWSVAVPRTSRKNDSENREPTGDRPLGDPWPEAVFSACHSSNVTDSEQVETSHNGRNMEENYDLYCRDISKWKASFAVFALSGFQLKERFETFFPLKIPAQIRTGSFWKLWVWKARSVIIN